MKILEFSIDWVRNVDLVTPLSVQARLNPKQEVFYFGGRASEQISRVNVIGDKPIEVEGVKIYPYDDHTRSFPVEFGIPDPQASEERKSLKEIWDIVQGEIAAPDSVIQERACIYEPPKKVPDEVEGVISGIDEFYQIEQSKGWRRRVAGFPCVSVQKMMKTELMVNGIIKKSNHPAFKRMRGVLLTATILPAVRAGKVVNIRSWQSTFKNNSIAHSFQKVLRAGMFWQDTAIIDKVERVGDSITGYIYRLEDRNKFLGI
ncbi:MAG TPA: hypothetical protein EYP68_01210 [Candidatus Korarchaeota archaeon]|nr:hypothetical protein [Candidatus Korarchaeota archaeon]